MTIHMTPNEMRDKYGITSMNQIPGEAKYSVPADMYILSDETVARLDAGERAVCLNPPFEGFGTTTRGGGVPSPVGGIRVDARGSLKVGGCAWVYTGTGWEQATSSDQTMSTVSSTLPDAWKATRVPLKTYDDLIEDMRTIREILVAMKTPVNDSELKLLVDGMESRLKDILKEKHDEMEKYRKTMCEYGVKEDDKENKSGSDDRVPCS